jgi:nicotinate-nucleotide adenylyltransferase
VETGTFGVAAQFRLNSKRNTQHFAPAVGVFGGTFDPIHFGHLRPAQEAMQKLALTELRFIPAAQPPHRPPPQASAAQRLAMVELAIRDLPGLRADDRELRRGGVSYTVLTLESLRAELGNASLCLLIGADQFRSFESWHRWQEIPDLAHLVVLNRPGATTDSQPVWARARVCGDYNILRTTPAGRLAFLSVRPQDISATDIRAALAHGESVQGRLPEAVLDYIRTNHIYDGHQDRGA